MSDNPNEAKQPKMENEIPICGDGWLAVFDLIAPRQLGLEIALLSHRFDYYVDEHFKNRKWTLGEMKIECKIGENGKKEMQIINEKEQSLPIPKVPPPKKVVGFEQIFISYNDQNVVDFLHRFRRTFASCGGIHLNIELDDDNLLEFLMHNIWPLIKDNICAMLLLFNNPLRYAYHLFNGIAKNPLCQMQEFDSSFLSDCPSLRTLYLFHDMFRSGHNSIASDRQLVAKWLLSPPLLVDGAPKMVKCSLVGENWSSAIAEIKAAFVIASSPTNFIISFWKRGSDDTASVVSFDLINQLTRERLTMKQPDNKECFFMLIRCPIARDESKWANWEEEMMLEWPSDFGQNKITIAALKDGSDSDQ